ncbi:hypothetical protein CN581_26890 [Bacillus toyonensis]|nr:hypothetical protein CN581_26890 [Bacillus toyonensis]
MFYAQTMYGQMVAPSPIQTVSQFPVQSNLPVPVPWNVQKSFNGVPSTMMMNKKNCCFCVCNGSCTCDCWKC